MNSQDNDQKDEKPNLESLEENVDSVAENKPDEHDITGDSIITGIDQAKADEEIADSRFDRDIKEKYANKLFWFLAIYTGVVLLAVGSQGLGVFCLHPIPLSLLISSIAVMTIGVGRFAAKGLDRHKLRRDESATPKRSIKEIIDFFDMK